MRAHLPLDALRRYPILLVVLLLLVLVLLLILVLVLVSTVQAYAMMAAL